MRPALVLPCVALLAACSSPPAADVAPAAVPSAVTPDAVLLTALGRVAAGAGSVRFSDDEELRTIQSVAPGPNTWGEIALFGSSGIGTESQRYGVRIDQAVYTVTVGAAPSQAVLVSGQQDAALLKTTLGKLGYKAEGDRLVAPAAAAAPVGQVRTLGTDVVLGGHSASLDVFSGSAVDPALTALATCLGDVVVAQLSGRVAVGVRASRTAEIRTVVCTTWDSPAAASAAADKQRAAYPAPASAEVTASGAVVRAVSTVKSPRTMFESLDKQTLPGITA
ncbi:hypothetical protein KZZ52_58615 [Dactylosporangium sp. AC04546]|uniref:hypothetical protein n=1 Tax=Dactylosporangium sp. AC04546 TaxID=2862460 RepID=UPI001EE0F7DE|nr:hypothetical protein [Dactylosporangium sp. AC04546]WVK83609.1 hypothetical protein KZZ52_58615 [Dactylosporangium sp. AC04546]